MKLQGKRFCSTQKYKASVSVLKCTVLRKLMNVSFLQKNTFFFFGSSVLSPVFDRLRKKTKQQTYIPTVTNGVRYIINSKPREESECIRIFFRQPLSGKQVKFTHLNESSKASDMFLMIIPQRTMLYSRQKYSMELKNSFYRTQLIQNQSTCMLT